MSPAPVAAIAVDLDGTLYRVRRLRVLWRLRRHRRVLLALMTARERLRREEAPDDGASLRAREVELVASLLSLGVDEARLELEALRQVLPRALTAGASPYRGVPGALREAHRQGFKLAVFSDYDPGDKLERLGLGGLPWSVQLGAETVGALKPHARGFHTLAGRLGLDPPSIIYIGDREDIDIAGALGAGLRAWRFAPRGHGETAAERVFGRWSAGLFLGIAGDQGR